LAHLANTIERVLPSTHRSPYSTTQTANRPVQPFCTALTAEWDGHDRASFPLI